eukprot:168655-Chlamydomonas_euryale.AAC.10
MKGSVLPARPGLAAYYGLLVSQVLAIRERTLQVRKPHGTLLLCRRPEHKNPPQFTDHVIAFAIGYENAVLLQNLHQACIGLHFTTHLSVQKRPSMHSPHALYGVQELGIQNPTASPDRVSAKQAYAYRTHAKGRMHTQWTFSASVPLSLVEILELIAHHHAFDLRT